MIPTEKYAAVCRGLNEAFGTAAVEDICALPAGLSSLPAFPKAFNYVTAHNGFIWRFRKAGLLPEDEVREVFAGYEQVCARR